VNGDDTSYLSEGLRDPQSSKVATASRKQSNQRIKLAKAKLASFGFEDMGSGMWFFGGSSHLPKIAEGSFWKVIESEGKTYLRRSGAEDDVVEEVVAQAEVPMQFSSESDLEEWFEEHGGSVAMTEEGFEVNYNGAHYDYQDIGGSWQREASVRVAETIGPQVQNIPEMIELDVTNKYEEIEKDRELSLSEKSDTSILEDDEKMKGIASVKIANTQESLDAKGYLNYRTDDSVDVDKIASELQAKGFEADIDWGQSNVRIYTNAPFSEVEPIESNAKTASVKTANIQVGDTIKDWGDRTYKVEKVSDTYIGVAEYDDTGTGEDASEIDPTGPWVGVSDPDDGGHLVFQFDGQEVTKASLKTAGAFGPLPQPGEQVQDYNDNTYTVIESGKFADLEHYDTSGSAQDAYEENPDFDEWVAVRNSGGETLVFAWGDDGVMKA